MRPVFSLLLLFSFLLLSCSSEEYTPPYDGPISFNTSISEEDMPTRASDTSWDNGDKVGIFMTKADYSLAYTGTHAANKLHTASTTGILTASGNDNKLYYPLDDSDVRFLAYYPYHVSATLTSVPVTISTAQTATNMKDYDVLWSDAGLFSRKSAQPSLTFTHMMSKIIVNVTWKSPEMNDVSAANRQGLVVRIAKIPITGTFSPRLGKFTAASGTTTPVQLYATTTNGTDYQGIIIPHLAKDFAGRQMEFEFTDNLTGKKETLTHPLTNDFGANTQYTYTVTLSRKGVTFTGCTIGGWEKTVTNDNITLTGS